MPLSRLSCAQAMPNSAKGRTKKPMAWYLYLKSMNRKIITMVQVKKTTDSNKFDSGAWPCPIS